MDKKEYLRSWAEAYRNDLTNNIMPFWLNHGWDRETAESTPASTVTDR